MNTRISVLSKKLGLRQIDWKFLLFLILFVNVKLVVKLVALVFIYVLNPDFHFGFRYKNSRLPFFYPPRCMHSSFELAGLLRIRQS